MAQLAAHLNLDQKVPGSSPGRTTSIHFSMKKDIHPQSYRPVVFQDINNDFKVLTCSTISLGDNPTTIKWENGKEYPLVKVPISSSSHRFYTGQKTQVDQMGIIAKFKAKYSKKK